MTDKVVPLNPDAAAWLEAQNNETGSDQAGSDQAGSDGSPPELGSLIVPGADTVIQELLQSAGTDGKLPADKLSQAAARLGVTPRWARELARRARVDEPPKRQPFQLTESHLEVIVAYKGKVLPAYKDLLRSGEPLPDYATFWRRYRELDAGLRAYWKGGGAKGMVAKWVFLPYTAPYRNAVWQSDHVEIPVDVIPEGHTTTTVKPWVTFFIDDKTRLVVGHVVVCQPGRRPDADSVSAGIADAVAVHQIRGVDVGGVPGSIRWDQALEYGAGKVTQLAAALGFEPHMVPPYSPFLKGKVERFNRTVEEELALMMDGFTHGSVTYTNHNPRRSWGPIPERLFKARLALWLDYYNAERPHSSLGGRTPLEEWVADSSPLRQARIEDLRMAFLVHPRMVKVSNKGIWHAGERWIGTGILELVDRKVQVHYPVTDAGFIEVYYQGKWFCTAYRAASLTEAEKKKLMAERWEQYQLARTLEDAAERRRHQAHSDAGESDAVPTVANTPSRDPLAASTDDLFDLLREEDDRATGTENQP